MKLPALAVLLASCSPATTRTLCDTSAIVLEVARPETPNAQLTAQVARLVRGLFCPRRQPTGATDRLPES